MELIEMYIIVQMFKFSIAYYCEKRIRLSFGDTTHLETVLGFLNHGFSYHPLNTELQQNGIYDLVGHVSWVVGRRG